ncbi:MAG: hypothetical protein ACLFWI_10510 [Coleofasciculus sp.]|uniref:hypothetical protein n=1 Tax=Coleofasciculus sp. TaxID=3100458 RepID=UPI003A432C99
MPTELDTPTPDKIEFLKHHKPPLQVGEYEITVTQEINGQPNPIITQTSQPFSEKFTTTKTFYVTGERFQLKPTDIHAVFPPAGSLGEHANALPHIILNRSTLPWERNAEPSKDTSKDNLPWLALLLFDEAEKPTQNILTLNELKNNSNNTRKFPLIKLETGQHDEDKVTVIDVNKKTLTQLLPTKDDLIYLSHVRQELSFRLALPWDANFFNDLEKHNIPTTINQALARENILFSQNTIISSKNKDNKEENKSWLITDNGNNKVYKFLHNSDNNKLEIYQIINELAVIISNRLPKKGGISTVHLVSLEGRYTSSGFDYQKADKDDDLIDKDDDLIRLVSLKSWSFACIDHKQSFKGLLNHLNREPSTLRLPKNDNPDAENYLAMGYVPLPHSLRQGDKTISWYHSPLIPGENTTPLTHPIRTADELLRYNPANGLFDISYAAAWELGRLLALQSKDFSIKLYHWKRSHAQRCCQEKQQHDCSHLPRQKQAAAISDTVNIPDAIASWLNNLSLLKGVPFNYLVPDETMLPPESIRFFWVDSLWIESLLDGAFSIGRITQSDCERDRSHVQNPSANPYKKVTGFLLRSAVVAGWPGLLVEGYDDITANNTLKLLRMERLSANVLICLFDGEVKAVDIHQKPETLHFGLDSDDGNTTFYKQLRDSTGKKNGKKIDSLPWSDKDKRVLNITQLAHTIQQNSTSAKFALEMIESVERVRFTITS